MLFNLASNILLINLGRRRRKVVRIVKRTLPKVYGCPNCGVTAVRVQIQPDKIALVSCGNCNLKLRYTLTGSKEPIDIYNEFVDQFMAGKIQSAEPT